MYVRATSTRFSRGMSTPAIRAIASALPLLVLGVLANDHHGAMAPDDLAVVATRLDGRSDLHGFLDYFSRYVMRPRVRSYGDSSTRTRSPGRIRMKFIRSLPLMCARTRWPFSSSTANIVFGSGSITVPSTSIASFFANLAPWSLFSNECRPGWADTRTVRISTTANSDNPAISDAGEDLRATGGDGDGVLEVGGQRAVPRRDRPVVVADLGRLRPEGEHRL